MKKAVLLLTLCSFLAMGTLATAAETFVTMWERQLNIVPTEDQVRDIAVDVNNGYMVSINRVTSSLKVYEAVPGQPNVEIKDVSTSGVTAGNYRFINGAFSDDGALFVCSLSVIAGYHLYYWSDINADPVEITVPRVGAGRWGDALDVIGRVDDNSVKVIVAGNQAAPGMQATVYTTTDNGASWNMVELANNVKCTDIHWDADNDGTFWATDGSVVNHYDATSAVIGSLTGSLGEYAVATDTNGLAYTIGLKTNALIKAWDKATGTLLTTHTDLLDQTFLGDYGFANGSCSMDIAYNPSGDYNIYSSVERAGIARYVYGTEIFVDGVGGGYPNYASVQAAIDSYHSGGDSTGTTTTKPLIISIDPYNGPYVGGIALDNAAQPLVGDLVVRSQVTTGVLAQLTVTANVNNDGIRVTQSTNSVAFIDLLMHTDIAANIVDDWFEVWDGATPPGTADWFELINCIVTASNTSGDPLVTTRNDAFNAPVDKADATGGSFNYLISAANTGNEAQNVNIDNTVLYGHGGEGSDAAIRFQFDGVEHKGYIYNSVIAYAGGAAVRASSTQGHPVAILGADAKSGTDNATVLYNPGFHALWLSAGGGKCDVDNVIFRQVGNRNISGAATSWALDIDNSILAGGGLNVLSDCAADATWSNNTFHGTSNAVYAWNGAASNGVTVTIVDSIFSGSGTKFVDQGVGHFATATVNCGFAPTVTKGASLDSETNSVDADPVYVSTDATSSDGFDVKNARYAGASSTAGDLSGGADFVGGAFTGSLIISELMDGQTDTTGFHRYAEITNVGSSDADLSEVAFANANNGASTFTGSTIDLATATGLPTLAPGASIVLTDDGTKFTTIYGFAADAVLGALNINGDDVVGIVQVNSNNVMDVYGVLGVDGTGENWEYLDTRVHRLTGASPNVGAFDVNGWIIADINDLDTPGAKTNGAHSRIGNPGFFDNNMQIATQIGVGSDLNGLTTPTLTFPPTALDVINGQTLVAPGAPYLGLHGAATGGVAVFTDGTDNAGGTDGLLADANGAAEPTRLEIDWSVTLGAVRIDQINTWSRNPGLDARAFINAHIYLDTTDDSTFNPTFYGEAITGAKGAVNSTNDWTALYVTDGRGSLVGGAPVYGMAIDFYSVTDTGTGFRFEGAAGGGSIIKEIDVLGAVAPTSVPDWTVFE